MPTDPEAADAPITMAALGAQLRSLRKTRELTLEQLAGRSGVSAGLLSQMERGQGNPSFNTLVQVAHALSVPVASLFRTDATGSPVVRHAERRRIDAQHSVAHSVVFCHGAAEHGFQLRFGFRGGQRPAEAAQSGVDGRAANNRDGEKGRRCYGEPALSVHEFAPQIA